MGTGEKLPVRDCTQLSAGDIVEAWHKGRLFHRGRVARVLPGTGLFWIEDLGSGTQRLLDVEALDVVLAVPPAVRAEALAVQAVPEVTPGMVWFSSA